MASISKRAFLVTLAGAFALPAYGADTPVIGFLHTASAEPNAKLVAAYLKGLGEIGFTDGRNVKIEYRWANNDYKVLPQLLADLIRRRVNVISSPAATQAAVAAKEATQDIPVVFGTGGDPVELGLVSSLANPGRNVTGTAFMNVELAGKRLGLLAEMAPQVEIFTILINPKSDLTSRIMRDAADAASALKRTIEFAHAASAAELESAFADLGPKQGVLVSPDALFTNRRGQIAALAARRKVPTIYYDAAFVEAGGLVSYGTSLADMYRQTAIYTGRVLKGEKPANMPVLTPRNYELTISLRAAAALGLDISPAVLSRADSLID